MTSIDQQFTQAKADIERAANEARYSRIGVLGGVMIAGMAPEIISKTGEKLGVVQRNVLPEPWDLPDHVGNGNEAALITTFVFSLVNNIQSRRGGAEHGPEDIRRAAMGAFVVSSLVQIVGEKYGQRVGIPNSGDMIDATYGIILSAFFAHALNLGYRAVDRREKEKVNATLATIKEISGDQPSKNSTSKNYKRPVSKKSKQKAKAKRNQQKVSRKKNQK